VIDRPFTTDGCSGGMSWFWRTFFRREPPWEGACVEHDKAYWQGGCSLSRFKADAALGAAVHAKGWPIMAVVMFVAVRAGGHPRWPVRWRWGYGCKYPSRYKDSN
jgi:hypothetical protein